MADDTKKNGKFSAEELFVSREKELERFKEIPSAEELFVSREEELERFKEILKESKDKTLRHSLMGNPGVGKSTLLNILFSPDKNNSTLPYEQKEREKKINSLITERVESMPVEIFEEEASISIDYYSQLIDTERVQKRPLHEAKMLLVGQGGVGKTQIANLLLGKDFNDVEPNTEGIDINEWYIEDQSKKVKVNIWDFGGQEIMHATHQFFLTKRSLYVFVWDARQEERYGQIDYWLKLIQGFSADSPVIVVLNKVDIGNVELDRQGLKHKYPTIRRFANISCKTGENFTTLQNLLQCEILKLPHIEELLLDTWFIVKDELQHMAEDFIEYSEYQHICKDGGIEGHSQEVLIDFLHDLGVVLNFREDPRLRYTNILKPNWVTNAVYKIINNPQIKKGRGILKLSQLNDILPKDRYPAYKHMVIIDMMKRFELCFEFDSPSNTFLIAGLLPVETPRIGWHYQGCLAFQYDYSFFPMSVISRFIVRMHKLIFKNTYWRNGVVLDDKQNRALIIADRDERKINIWVKGQRNTRRDFLAKIRKEFEDIHFTIPKIEITEKVLLPNHPHIVVDYQYLLDLEEMDEETFVPIGLKERVNVKDLLAGVGYRRGSDFQNSMMTDLYKKIGEFLLSLPQIHDSTSQKAFIYSANLDPQLQSQIIFGRSSVEFVQMLIMTIRSYGILENGQNAFEIILEVAKRYVGKDKRQYCDSLIAELHSII